MGDKVRNINTYIKNTSIQLGYENAITVEHRSNNTKRDFLFVNRFQCKHIPSSPLTMEGMCKDLAAKCDNIREDDKVLVIGFAETATALGRIVAEYIPNCIYTMCTTREDIEGSLELIRFEEEHSHATTQKLLIYNNDSIYKIFDRVTYILFVDDELTTGKTILNFINAFNKKFNNNFRFGVASVCNWQNEENIKAFTEKKIDRYFLIGGELEDTNVKMEIPSEYSIIEYGNAITRNDCCIDSLYKYKSDNFSISRLGYLQQHCTDEQINEIKGDILFRQLDIDNVRDKSIRVIGSEECMYAAIKVGQMLETFGAKVICHSTTRSKIDVFNTGKEENPSKYITERHKVASAYNIDRDTYIYNTSESTDLVVLISDTEDDICFNNFIYTVGSLFEADTRIIAYRV